MRYTALFNRVSLTPRPPIRLRCDTAFSVRRRVGRPYPRAADIAAGEVLALGEDVRNSWNGPLRYFFSFALPASNFIALYSDVISCSLQSFLLVPDL